MRFSPAILKSNLLTRGYQFAGFASERIGYRYTILIALITITGFIFIPFVSSPADIPSYTEASASMPNRSASSSLASSYKACHGVSSKP